MPIPSPAGVRRSSSTSSKSVGQRFRGCSGRRPRAWERGVGWINFWIQERKIIDSILTADGWGEIHRFRKQQIGEDLAHVGAMPTRRVVGAETNEPGGYAEVRR